MTRPAAKPVLYTIGHSNRTMSEFASLLEAHRINRVVDIRTVPKSRHNPQFNEGRLRTSLRRRRIGYARAPALGGFRHARKDSKNAGWRNASFRGFADYLATESFESGLRMLERGAKKRNVAIMCAEAVPWRCHRSLIADALLVRGWKVLHIQSRKTARVHRRTPFLRVRGGVLTYPATAASRERNRPARTRVSRRD